MILLTPCKTNILRYVGDPGQLCGIKEYALSSGKARGVKAFDIKNGTGLEYTILSDRCLDISNLSFNGVNCSYLSKTGLVAPGYYNDSDTNFFRGFYAGFLTTCGLRNVGNACRDKDELFGMHGRISHVPAEEVCASTEWIEGEPMFTVKGKIRESSFFGENLLLERTITCRYGENRITIKNLIENNGFKPEIIMFLLHFNIGYPLLDSCSYFLSSSKKIIPRDAEAAKGINKYARMQSPMPDFAEQVFYHELNAGPDGNTCVALINPQLQMAVSFTFDIKRFFNFAQWKQMGEGEYVLGIEPCNCFVGGRTDPRNEGVLTWLQPGEKQCFTVNVDLYSGAVQLNNLEREITGLSKTEKK